MLCLFGMDIMGKAQCVFPEKITENADKCPGAEWFRDIFTVPQKGIPSLFLPERYCANGKHYDIVVSSKMGWFGDSVSHPEKEFEESDALQQA